MQVLTVSLSLDNILWEIVKYLELNASIEANTAMILSANGCIFSNTYGSVSISK